MRKLTDKQQAAIDLLAEFPEASKRKIASLLIARRPELFETHEAARMIVKRVTGTAGDRARVNQKIPNKTRADGQIYSMPKSKAKPWTPHVATGKSIAILSDIHFPKHDETALQNAVDHIKSNFKPDTILLNGDVADAEEFGSWAKSPKAVDTENAVEIVRQGLLWLLQEFPRQKFIYKFGNHEERLERYCWSRAPELVGLPHITWQGLLSIDNELKPVKEMSRIEFVSEQRPVMLGKLPIFHGHELPKGLTNSVNPARGAFLRMIDTAVIGHHHRSSSHVEYNWRHEPINCWSVGCLCDLTPEYARINKWNHGHSVVDVSKSGGFSVHNFKHLSTGEVVTA
jgi:predicted phosphodiesterase